MPLCKEEDWGILILTSWPKDDNIMSCFVVGPMEYVEPDVSSLPPPRPMSPDPTDKRDSISEKSKQGTSACLSSASVIMCVVYV